MRWHSTANEGVLVLFGGSGNGSTLGDTWAGLIGLHVHLQGWASAPGANASNTIVSNGVEWVIGNS